MKLLRNKNFLVIVITIVLFIIPFFWLKLGEMDLGGDSNRLYFYDPLSNLKAFAIYSVPPWGTGVISYNQYFLPFLLLMTFLKFIFQSPTILIDIFNGIKLSGSFIFTYLIIKELFLGKTSKGISIAQQFAAILASFFYVFSPAVLDNTRYALVTHDQVFLNPLIIYLLLKFLKTNFLKYIWIALLVTLIFSTNFSLQAPPPLFAFYPLTFIFLLIYNKFVLEKPFSWKGILFGLFFFLFLNAFQLIPVVSNLFDKGSELNTRAFEGLSKNNVGLEYFTAILPYGKVSLHVLLPLENAILPWTLITMPLLIFLGLLFSKKSKTLLLVSSFFFVTLFLVCANITDLGVEIYKKLFYIPGFGMFRNFYGQWQWIYTFFYALFAGLSISYLFSQISKRFIYIITIVSVVFLLGRSAYIFNGKIINVTNRGTDNLSVVVRIDPHYKEMLKYIKNISNDGKILQVPFTDFRYNLVGGTNNGVYVGQSMVSLLDGKNDFSGYQDIDPFSESFREILKEKDYSKIKQMLNMLQVRYVLYNGDERVSDKYFKTFPYGYTGVPASTSASLNFVNKLSSKKVYQTGNYSLFEVSKDEYLPHFYIASSIIPYSVNPKYDTQYSGAISFFPGKSPESKDIRIAYVNQRTCAKLLVDKECKNQVTEDLKSIQVIYQRVNSTKYKVEIKNATKPFLLVFQTAFGPQWKIYDSKSSLNLKNWIDSYFDGKIIESRPINKTIDSNPFETNSLREDTYQHIQVNGYANAWYIDGASSEYNLIIEETSQKMVYYSLLISGVTLILFIGIGIKLFKNND